MPLLTFLSEEQVRRFSWVDDDEECNGLLQDLRVATGENWLVRVETWRHYPRSSWFFGLFAAAEPIIRREYRLYHDAHGEWQIMNLFNGAGGTAHHDDGKSREHVMNFMLGYLSATESAHAKLERLCG